MSRELPELPDVIEILKLPADGGPQFNRLIKKELGKRFLPRSVLVLRNAENQVEHGKVCTYAETQAPMENNLTVYLCEGFVCQSPTRT